MGQSQVSLRSVSGLSQASLSAYFIRQTELKILCLVKEERIIENNTSIFLGCSQHKLKMETNTTNIDRHMQSCR